MSYWCGKWGSAYQACDQQLFLVTGTSWRYEDVTDYLNLAGERYWYNTLAHSFTDALLVSQIHSRHTEHLTELNRRRAWTQLIFTHRYICYRDWRTGTSTLLCQPTRWASRRAVSQRHLKIASLRLQWRERRGGGGGAPPAGQPPWRHKRVGRTRAQRCDVTRHGNRFSFPEAAFSIDKTRQFHELYAPNYMISIPSVCRRLKLRENFPWR